MLHKASILPRNKDHDCYCGGVVNWRTAIVHYVAKAVGLHVKIEGFPLGTTRNLTAPTSPNVVGGNLHRIRQ